MGVAASREGVTHDPVSPWLTVSYLAALIVLWALWGRHSPIWRTPLRINIAFYLFMTFALISF